MQTDTVLRSSGMQVLSQHLGIVEAERFITLIQRESFDYTQWRQELFDGVPLKQFLEDAQKYRPNTRE